MALTHFIEGVHTNLINGFPYIWAGPFERFLKGQRKNNPQAVAHDEDLQWAIVKMDARETKGRIMQRSQDYPEDEEEEEAEGSVKRMQVGRGANK